METTFLIGLAVMVVSALIVNKRGYYLFAFGVILILLGFLYATITVR